MTLVHLILTLLLMLVASRLVGMADLSTLKVATWNSRGFRAAVPYLRDLLDKHDIVAVCETWLHENRVSVLDDVCTTHHVHARSSNRSSAADYGVGRGQGGVALYWNKKIKSVSIVPGVMYDRACGIRVQNSTGGVCYFWSVYLPAMGSDEDLGTSLDDLAEVIGFREVGASVVIMGDFNGDIGRGEGGRGVRVSTVRGRMVREFMLRENLVAANMLTSAQGPIDTFEGPLNVATLDYIMVSGELTNKIRWCEVADWHPVNGSDHTSVHAELDMGEIPVHTGVEVKSSGVRWDKMTPMAREQRYTSVLAPMLDALAMGYAGAELSHELIDGAFTDLIGHIRGVSDGLPKSRFRKNLKPYWNQELRNLKRAKVEAYRRWVESGRPREHDVACYLWYKSTKKAFMVRLRQLSRDYENAELLKAVQLAEMDRNAFWRVVKKARGSRGVSSIAIKNRAGKVVYEVPEVLEVWRNHFAQLGTPVDSPIYDRGHFEMVTRQVALYNSMRDDDDFSDAPFTCDEVQRAIKTLNKGKACGADNISAEHLCYGGEAMVRILCTLYNMIRELEYIPKCFRVGLQVPLHKGKDASPLDTDSYRGITLLSTFNKVFEVLFWKRIEAWWNEVGAVSGLQSACRKGLSCLNAGFLLRETVATAMEDNDVVYVAFFDVAKAFDSVWVDGLFYQLWNIGIRGKTWRLMYRCYVDFWCAARVQGHVSGWYNLGCGIHQGGYMSLIKYTAFINSLIGILQESGMCCSVRRIPSTPVGYADDLATCSLTERRLEGALSLVYQHGCRWRYRFNAKKSGILVFGETPGANRFNAERRRFELGGERVRERLSYEHVGVTLCLYETDVSGVKERLSKARRALNAVSGLGIRRNGLTIATCNAIFWTIVVPIALFGSELWILTDECVNLVESFQNYAGKRVQRLHSRGPNACAFYGLGWIRLERLIEVRKMLFIRSILSLGVDEPSRGIFCIRLEDFMRDLDRGRSNVHGSVVFDMLNVAEKFGMLEDIVQMVRHGHMWMKGVWKNRVWERAWELDRVFWEVQVRCHQSLDLLSKVGDGPNYLVWWQISDSNHALMRRCEIMVKLLSHASMLKNDDVRLKSLPMASRFCDLCDLGVMDDAKHMIMQCPALQQFRNEMFNELTNIEDGSGREILDSAVEVCHTLMGKIPDVFTKRQMELFCSIVAKYVCDMYTFKTRTGIG